MAVVVCAECGERSPEGVQFCGACGAFLDWETAVESASGTVPQQSGPEVRPEAVTPERVPAEAVPAERVPAERVPAEAAPAAVTPEVVRPGEARARRPVVVAAPPRPLEPDEQPCPRCAAGNTTGRRFCRACGAALAPAVAPPRLSWWQRWWRRVTTRTAYAAGTRRRVRSRAGARRLSWLLVLAAGVAAVAVAVPTGLLRRADDAVRDRFTQSTRIAARVVQASSAARGAPAANLVDGASNRYWAPAGKAIGSSVELSFSAPIRLLHVKVTAGASVDPAAFAAQGRPHQVTAVVLTSSGRTAPRTLTLLDQPGPQDFDVRVSAATGIRLTIMSTYGMPPARVCAIGELEFVARP